MKVVKYFVRHLGCLIGMVFDDRRSIIWKPFQTPPVDIQIKGHPCNYFLSVQSSLDHFQKLDKTLRVFTKFV